MEGMITIIVLAIIVEALVEYGKNIGRAFMGEGWKKAVPQLAAVIGGIVVCFAAGADLFAELGMTFSWSWLGQLLTGIIISRGANYVSDFMQRLTIKKEAA